MPQDPVAAIRAERKAVAAQVKDLEARERELRQQERDLVSGSDYMAAPAEAVDAARDALMYIGQVGLDGVIQQAVEILVTSRVVLYFLNRKQRGERPIENQALAAFRYAINTEFHDVLPGTLPPNYYLVGDPEVTATFRLNGKEYGAKCNWREPAPKMTVWWSTVPS